MGRPPIILKYDAVEVTVSDGRIDLIHVEFDESLPAFVSDAGLSRRSTRAEVERLLADHGVTYEPYAPLTLDDEQSALIASSQVVVVFREDGHLAAISSARSA